MQRLKKLTDLTKLGRMYFTGDDDYQNFLVFGSMLSSLTLDNNEKVANWISTRVLPKKSNHLILTLN